jgi:hypothetical protein
MLFDIYLQPQKRRTIWKQGLSHASAIQLYNIMVAKGRGKEVKFKDSTGRFIDGKNIKNYTPQFTEKKYEDEVKTRNDESESSGPRVESDNSDGSGEEISESTDRELRKAFARSRGQTDTAE